MSDKSAFQLRSFLFSFKGRVSRRPYATLIIPLWALFSVSQHGFQQLANYIATMHGVIMPAWWYPTIIFCTIFELVCLWVITSQTAKRLHDIGHSGKWALLIPLRYMAAFVLPLIILQVGSAYETPFEDTWPWVVTYSRPLLYFKYALWAATLALCFIRGNRGPNRYGTSPRQPDLPLA